MVSVADALALVRRHARPLPPTTLPLTSAALGLVLAEDVVSDLDSPAYDKTLMDGYAVRSVDLPEGKGTLTVVEEVTAGRVPTKALGPGEATRLMTGAPIPAGADAVVAVERTRLDGDRVVVDHKPPTPGQHILRRASEMRRGDVALRSGAVLRPQEFGLLATVGRTSVRVVPPPTVAVLATGDELVDAGQTPGPGQIRNGNGPMLCAQVSRGGGLPRALGIGRDTPASLHPLIAEGLAADVLILSGGVSAGKLDLVPGLLAEAGVTAHFHKVEMKPGKPVLFGTKGTTLVFGLPGNPVSSLVCFELFVRPALRLLAGHADAGPFFVDAALADDFAYKSDRPTYHPAWLDANGTVRPVPWFGSADLRAVTSANAFVLLPPGDSIHRGGQTFPVLRTEG